MSEKQDRKWWPEEWMDESMPPGKPSPDAYIIKLADGMLALGYHVGDLLDEEEFKLLQFPVAIGDIVRFTYCDDHGEVEVIFKPDGSYQALGPVPEGYSHCWVQYDSDTLSDSLTALAALVKDNADIIEASDSWTVAFWFYPEHAIPFRLVDTADGPRFLQVSTAEARQ